MIILFWINLLREPPKWEKLKGSSSSRVLSLNETFSN